MRLGAGFWPTPARSTQPMTTSRMWSWRRGVGERPDREEPSTGEGTFESPP